ncbi:MAG: ATP-binding cassette domain-containing protein [Acidiphilium sp.]|nr:ATP-binding cassette domain-containing protein [Acidiphilium sp.]MDD4935567.1 ATP-binding cassette domain-containing protein [Acidiphilium sp.]
MRLVASGLTGAAGGPFDFSLQPGAAMAITGPSGAGKSVLLRMIADLDPHGGTVTLDGADRAIFTAPAWRKRVAYLAAEPGWWHDDTAPHFPDRARAEALMPGLALDPKLLVQPVHRLSTGERMRLALIRVLLNDPAVLLLDEPTGALDPHATSLVETILLERQRTGTALIIVTHDMDQAARLGARRFHLEAGTLTPQ